MTDNEKLARWQGKIDSNKINLFVKTPTGFWPDYLNDDAATMPLLDTLVEKGYKPMLTYCDPHWHFHYNWIYGQDGNGMPSCFLGKTRREAVVAACLELIGKENQRDQTK